MPDYMFLLESRLSPEQRAMLVRVQEIATALETNIYLTGGAVRDLISGMPIRDLDFTVEGNPFRIAAEAAKSGARVVEEDERRRHVEIIFAGEADGSIAAARDEVYERPGTKPEIRWATIMEDLRRRDFSINAVALSLNPASRGLLLDPTNGLADLEKHEVRALSIHSFTNQPIRLLRILRYCARMGFKMEPRTAEWFALALERGLHQSLAGGDVGWEVRRLAREDKLVPILKTWEIHDFLAAIHPQLGRRHPDYAGLAGLVKVRNSMLEAGYRPRLFPPVTHYLLRRLKPRERSAASARMEFSASEKDAVVSLEEEALKAVKMLRGRSTATPLEAYRFLEKVQLDLFAFIQAEYSQPKALSKIRNFLYKWKPLRLSLPVAELESLGVPRGPKFDKILEDLFERQLAGKGRTPQDRTRLLRQLAGIKPEPKKKKPKKEEKKKKPKPEPASKAAGQPAPSQAAAPPLTAGTAAEKPPVKAARPEREAARKVKLAAKPAPRAPSKRPARAAAGRASRRPRSPRKARPVRAGKGKRVRARRTRKRR